MDRGATRGRARVPGAVPRRVDVAQAHGVLVVVVVFVVVVFVFVFVVVVLVFLFLFPFLPLFNRGRLPRRSAVYYQLWS